MTTLVGLWNTFWTVPYWPLPSSSISVSSVMLILYDWPDEKSTPSACRTALDEKLSRPEASLSGKQRNKGVSVRNGGVAGRTEDAHNLAKVGEGVLARAEAAHAAEAHGARSTRARQGHASGPASRPTRREPPSAEAALRWRRAGRARARRTSHAVRPSSSSSRGSSARCEAAHRRWRRGRRRQAARAVHEGRRDGRVCRSRCGRTQAAARVGAPLGGKLGREPRRHGRASSSWRSCAWRACGSSWSTAAEDRPARRRPAVKAQAHAGPARAHALRRQPGGRGARAARERS